MTYVLYKYVYQLYNCMYSLYNYICSGLGMGGSAWEDS